MTTAPVGSNVKQVERLLGAVSAGDDATVLALVDPAVELIPLVVAAGLVDEPYRGLDGVRDYLGNADAAEIERGFVSTRLYGVRDTVVAFGYLVDGDVGATARAMWVWRLRNGLVTHGTLVSRGGARSPLWLELPAMPECVGEARHAVQIWADNLTLTRRERIDILLAVSEAATNAVRHGYPRRAGEAAFQVIAEVTDHRLSVTVADEGVGLVAPSHDPGLGMGLPLLDKLSAGLTIVSPPERPRGLEVRMCFALESLA